MDKNEFIVDRIEEEILIVEYNKSVIEININLIKGIVKEGDVLVKLDKFYEVDHIKTNLRKDRINSMMKGIWKE